MFLCYTLIFVIMRSGFEYPSFYGEKVDWGTEASCDEKRG
jgi:hypothetical protein